MKQSDSIKNRYLAPLLVLLLALFAWFAWHQITDNSINMADSGSLGGDSSRRNIYYGPRNSVAVLPFSNLSGLAGQEALAEGFAAELLKLLIRDSRLQVTARTSSFFFRDETVQQRLVGERLQSSHLLTGGFELGEGRVLVQARLFDTRKNEEIWSQHFERKLDDIFDIQDEILAEVLENMSVGSGDEQPAAVAIDTSAWIEYLQAEHFRYRRTAEALQTAEQSYQAVLAIEPDYGPALYGQAEARMAVSQIATGSGVSLEQAREALDRALQAHPESAESWGLLGFVRLKFDWDWNGAVKAAQHAVELNPGDAALTNIASLALFTLGRFEGSERMLKASIERDPLNLSIRLRLGLLYEFMSEYDESLAVYRQVIGLNPEFPGARAYRARVKLLQDKPDSALRESDGEPDEFWRDYSRLLALSALERNDEAEILLERMIEDHGQDAAYQIAEILAFRGEIDSAFDWLQRAREQRDGGLAEVTGNRFLENLHADPRWAELMSLLAHPLD